MARLHIVCKHEMKWPSAQDFFFFFFKAAGTHLPLPVDREDNVARNKTIAADCAGIV